MEASYAKSTYVARMEAIFSIYGHTTLNIQKVADAAKKTASPIAKRVPMGYRKAEFLLKCSFVSSGSNRLSSILAKSFILGVSLVNLFFFHGEDQVSDLLVYSSSRKSGR